MRRFYFVKRERRDDTAKCCGPSQQPLCPFHRQDTVAVNKLFLLIRVQLHRMVTVPQRAASILTAQQKPQPPHAASDFSDNL